jgi:hypothetical protein
LTALAVTRCHEVVVGSSPAWSGIERVAIRRHNPRMTVPALEAFIAQAALQSRDRPDPADCVLALAPLMLELIDHAGTFLEPQHYRSIGAPTRRSAWREAARCCCARAG